MADPKDIEATRIARREFVKHRVDVNLADLRVSHGVVYLRGIVRAERGAPYTSLQAECEKIARIIRQKANVRDVVLDVTYRT